MLVLLYNFIFKEMKCVNYCQGRIQDFEREGGCINIVSAHYLL